MSNNERASGRATRSDKERNFVRLVAAAKLAFDKGGLEVAAREIAGLAGVGLGTLYRHFPQRCDLVAAVYEGEIAACADAAETLIATKAPWDALTEWANLFVELVVAKRSLGTALIEGLADADMSNRREQRLRPTWRGLFTNAALASVVRPDVDPDEILVAIASICVGAPDVRQDYAQRMAALLLCALRA